VLPLLTQAKGVAGRIGMDDEDAPRLLDPTAQDRRPEGHRSTRSATQIRDREIQMGLLGCAVRPIRRLVGPDLLESQLEVEVAEPHLTPLRIGRVQLTVEQLCVEGGEGRGVRAVEHDRPQAHRGPFSGHLGLRTPPGALRHGRRDLLYHPDLVAATSGAMPSAALLPTFPLGPFTPYPGNPIVRPQGDGWESTNLYNPAAIVVDDEVVMLYRAHGPDLRSRIGLATSRDGFHFEREAEPVVSPEHDYEARSCEGPRVSRVGETFYLTYTGSDGVSSGQIAIARATPTEVIVRTTVPWLRPQTIEERQGLVANVTFVEGLVQFEGRWLAYYGQSDTTLAVAVFDPSEESYRAER
jgi:hypothetical protein